MANILNKIKDMLWFINLKQLISKPKLFLLSLLFDSLFIITILGIAELFTLFIPNNPQVILEKFGTGTVSFFSLIFITFFYIFLIIFIYSFFKYIILDVLKNYVSKTEFRFGNLSKFYIMNISIVFGQIFILILIVSILKFSLRPEYFSNIMMGITVLFAVICYLLFNATHTYFIFEPELGKSLSAGIRFTFMKIKVYYKLILIMFAEIIIFLVAYLILLYIAKNFQNETLYLILGQFLKIFSFVYLYIAIIFNRSYFYLIISEQKNVL